ncbi:MAG: membrane protein insertion efficiency factor YidD [Mycobacteriaceae bacterium]
MTAKRAPAEGGLARAVIAAIEAYRHMISPLRPPTCRFMPTCSQYAVDAVTEYGVLRGGWLAMRRLGKCGPWHRGGWDPIPERSGAGDGSLPAGRSEATRESTPQLRSADV